MGKLSAKANEAVAVHVPAPGSYSSALASAPAATNTFPVLSKTAVAQVRAVVIEPVVVQGAAFAARTGNKQSINTMIACASTSCLSLMSRWGHRVPRAPLTDPGVRFARTGLLKLSRRIANRSSGCHSWRPRRLAGIRFTSAFIVSVSAESVPKAGATAALPSPHEQEQVSVLTIATGFRMLSV